MTSDKGDNNSVTHHNDIHAEFMQDKKAVSPIVVSQETHSLIILNMAATVPVTEVLEFFAILQSIAHYRRKSPGRLPQIR